jgi:kynurenine formamidase
VEIIDVSVPVRPGMVVYPGDPDVRLDRVLAIADGDPANVSRLDFGAHTGTHVDAPVHFVEGAPGAESLPLAALVGIDYLSIGGEEARGAAPCRCRGDRVARPAGCRAGPLHACLRAAQARGL